MPLHYLLRAVSVAVRIEQRLRQQEERARQQEEEANRRRRISPAVARQQEHARHVNAAEVDNECFLCLVMIAWMLFVAQVVYLCLALLLHSSEASSTTTDPTMGHAISFILLAITGFFAFFFTLLYCVFKIERHSTTPSVRHTPLPGGEVDMIDDDDVDAEDKDVEMPRVMTHSKATTEIVALRGLD